MSSRQVRRAQTSDKHNGDAVEFLVNTITFAFSEAKAIEVVDAIISCVRPAQLEGIARSLGWCHKCQGTGFVSGHPVEECGDVPCRECR